MGFKAWEVFKELRALVKLLEMRVGLISRFRERGAVAIRRA